MDRELKNLTLNISQLAALSGVHRQTAAARLQNLPVAGGHESNLKLYRVVDIVSAFLALPPPVAEGEMDVHERKAWYESVRSCHLSPGCGGLKRGSEIIRNERILERQ